jgi:SOS-response transcriptional repressor LexA
MLGVTVRQQEILRMVHDFAKDKGYPPSIREIGNHFDISSLRGVTVHLDALERKDLIKRLHTARSIRLLPAAYELLSRMAPSDETVSRETLCAVRAAMETAVGSLVRNIDAWAQVAGQVTLGRQAQEVAEQRIADNRLARRGLIEVLGKIRNLNRDRLGSDLGAG